MSLRSFFSKPPSKRATKTAEIETTAMRRLSVTVETDGALIQWLAAARQRKVTSTTLSFSLRVVVFSFSTVLAELLKTRSCLESRAQCWFAADIAASLADAGPPRDERADTVKLSGPIGNGCVTCAALQPDTRGATGAVYHPAVTTASAREAAISAGNHTAYGSPNSYSF